MQLLKRSEAPVPYRDQRRLLAIPAYKYSSRQPIISDEFQDRIRDLFHAQEYFRYALRFALLRR